MTKRAIHGKHRRNVQGGVNVKRTAKKVGRAVLKGARKSAPYAKAAAKKAGPIIVAAATVAATTAAKHYTNEYFKNK